MSYRAVSLEQVRQLPKTHSTSIDSSMLDAMGHMNVMWYTHLFAFGTRGILKEVGIDWDRLAEQDEGTFALEQHVRYLSEVRAGQPVSIHSRAIGRRSGRFHLLHFMVNEEKQNVAAIFEAISAFVDLKIRRMAPMKPLVAAAFDQLIEAHQQLSWPAPVCGVMNP